MADEGFVLLWRKAFNHDLWTKKRAFSEWEAWTDLWANQAAFSDHKKFVAGKSITVARGQLVASQRFLAKRWRWSVGKVRRFLVYLEAQDMMRAESRMNAGRIESDTGIGTLYTVVNYPLLQDLKAAIVSATDRQRTGNGPKIKKGKKETEDSTEVESAAKRSGKLWAKNMGGTIPQVRINVALKPLIVVHGADEVLDWWGKYLADPKSSARYKTPENFAQRFGAWRAEHTTNGASVEDVRHALRLGGAFLSDREGRSLGFDAIRSADPELWTRLQPQVEAIDWGYLSRLTGNGFELDRAIKGQLERT